ncbi:hypothetical protein J5N97_007184 [Dioscorea zingiberensis]|uniref:Transmembrane protein n=1 Tax=Dioscorea zingiberensis TaxID=325984 RepID=A0A9D5DBB8_9LILI|nr:hypothetical protein J5N97_007184 [Dioscorea zingiberensis]
MRAGSDDQRVFYELCALLFSVIKSPPGAVGVSSPTLPPTPRAARVGAPRRSQVTPAAFASLLLGVSLALMLCGSVTFVIGFMLMPWVLGMVMVFYFVGIVSSLSGIGRAMFCPSTSSPKEIQGRSLFSKLPII